MMIINPNLHFYKKKKTIQMKKKIKKNKINNKNLNKKNKYKNLQ
jgi:hypothetical protein